MKKYSSEARELLSTMEQYDVKAGGNDTTIVISPNICVTPCATCVNCNTQCAICIGCVACTTWVASSK